MTLCDVDLTIIRGIGAAGSVLEALVRDAVELLRSQGITVCLGRVTVPAMDDEVEPVILVNGKELYVPPLELNPGLLANLIVYELFKAVTLANTVEAVGVQGLVSV